MKSITLTGNLGNDSKIKESNGEKWLTFPVAVNEKYKNRAGEVVESVEWWNCNLQNINMAQWLKKGTKVLIQGKPSFKAYINEKDGKAMPALNIVVFQLELLGGVKKEENNQAQNSQPDPANSLPVANVSTVADDDGDLPF